MEIKEIVKTVKPYNPEKVILFGSQATGKAQKDSDWDLLLVKKTRKRYVERIGELLGIIGNSGIPIDPVIYTPKELKKAQEEHRYFLERVFQEGKIIYEKK